MPGDLRELATYVVSCSLNSLGSFYLQRLDRASHLEQDLRKVARELVESLALAELAELFLHHGEEIIAANAHALAEPRSTPRTHPERFWWWHVVSEPSISVSEEHICSAIQMYAAKGKTQDGWTDKVTFTALGCGKLSPGRSKAISRALRNRTIIETQGREGDPQGQRYRLRPQAEWLRKDDRVRRKGRPGKREPRLSIRFDIKADSCSMWVDGSAQQKKMRGRPRFRLTDSDGTDFVDSVLGEGSANFQIPKTTPIDQPGSLATPVPGTGSINDPGSSAPAVAEPGGIIGDPGGTGTRSINDPGSVASEPIVETETRLTRVPVMEGHVLVKHPRGVVPFTDRERRTMAAKHGGQPRAEVLVEYFQAKHYEAEIKFRSDWKGWPKTPAPPASVSPEPKRLSLDRTPNGSWDKAKVELKTAINPHTWETWIKPTVEAGSVEVSPREFALVVLVPGRPHARMLQEKFAAQIRTALAAATGDHKKQVQFIVEGDVEIVPPGSQTVEQYAGKLARGGTHK